jgi:hypothetical protein
MPTLAISPCHTPQHPIYTHTHKRRDTMNRLDDFFFYGIMAALSEAALRAGGV